MATIIEPDAIPYGIGNEFAGEDKYAMREIHNPMAEPFKFTWGGKDTVIPANGKAILPDFMAVRCSKKLAEWICDSRWPQKNRRDTQLNYTSDQVHEIQWKVLNGDFDEKEKNIVIPKKKAGAPDSEDLRIVETVE